jgi:hypothetical protein
LRSPFIAACCAFAIVLSIGAEAQDNPVPDGLKDKALVVSLHAVVLAGADSAAWQSDSRRVTMPGMPVGVKLVNANVVVIIQLTPYDDGKGGLVLVTQGQVWVRTSSGELSYRTTMDTVPVGYGERVYFFPFGRSQNGEAPMRVEVVVNRYPGDLPSATDKSLPPLGPQPSPSESPASPPLLQGSPPLPGPNPGSPPSSEGQGKLHK